MTEEEMNGSRKYSRNEKIFYVISVIIVFSMVFGMIAVAVTPAGF
jgi:cell division protein FtsL